jgi:hypothetical protein
MCTYQIILFPIQILQKTYIVELLRVWLITVVLIFRLKLFLRVLKRLSNCFVLSKFRCRLRVFKSIRISNWFFLNRFESIIKLRITTSFLNYHFLRPNFHVLILIEFLSWSLSCKVNTIKIEWGFLICKLFSLRMVYCLNLNRRLWANFFYFEILKTSIVWIWNLSGFLS